jgi:hypothetical protein
VTPIDQTLRVDVQCIKTLHLIHGFAPLTKDPETMPFRIEDLDDTPFRIGH